MHAYLHSNKQHIYAHTHFHIICILIHTFYHIALFSLLFTQYLKQNLSNFSPFFSSFLPFSPFLSSFLPSSFSMPPFTNSVSSAPPGHLSSLPRPSIPFPFLSFAFKRRVVDGTAVLHLLRAYCIYCLFPCALLL